MMRFHYHYAGQIPHFESVLSVAHDLMFAFAFTQSIDVEWWFVMNVRNEMFCDTFEKLTGCIDSGLT